MVSPTKQNKGTVRSHLVWQRYLNSFADKKSRIFCKNKETGKTFLASTEYTAVSKNLYTLDTKISSSDILLFENVWAKNQGFDDHEKEFISDLVAFLNNDLEYFYPYLKEISINSIVESVVDENALKRNQEELCTHYEDNFSNIYSLLLEKNSSFYNDLLNDKESMLNGYFAGRYLKTSNFLHTKSTDLLCRIINEITPSLTTLDLRNGVKHARTQKEKDMEKQFPFSNETNFASYYFLIFLLTQAFRTSKVLSGLRTIEERLPKNLSKYRGKINYNSLAILTIHSRPYSVGFRLIEANYRIIFIENQSETDFITSDHPVINIYSLFKDAMEMSSDELEFYYPLSPRLAILLTKKTCYSTVTQIYASELDVKEYNKLVYNASKLFIFSGKEELLASL